MFQENSEIDSLAEYYSQSKSLIDTLLNSILIQNFSLDLDITERVLSILLLQKLMQDKIIHSI